MSRREYARLRVDVWDDDDFRALPPLAQWLYLHLLTHPSLSFCGVVDWRPRRIAVTADHLSADAVVQAMRQLVAARFVIVDEDTEEALVRTFVRHDGLLASPNVTTAMVREFRGIASRRLRGVVVHELRRLHEDQPDLKGWGRAEGLLLRESIDPYRNPSGNPSANPSGDPSPDPSSNRSDAGGEPLPHSVLPAVTSIPPDPFPDSLPPSPTGGSARAGVRGQAREEPPPRCPQHLHAPTAGACGPCGDARKAHERWEREDAQRRRDAGPVVGVDCPEHPGQPAGRCGPCIAQAAPGPPAGWRQHLRGVS